MKQNLIYYQGGCYGTFIEWICNFLTDTIDDQLPLKDNGSSHKFKGNFFYPIEKLFEHIQSGNKVHFSRCHPNILEKANEHEVVYQESYDNILQKDFDFLKNNFDKIVFLTYDERSTLWFENNALDKIYVSEKDYDDMFSKYGYEKEFLQEYMIKDSILRLRYNIEKRIKSKNSPFKTENLMGWGKTDIFKFDVWELRELLSLFWFSGSDGRIKAYKTSKENNGDIEFIFIHDLKTKFVDSILRLANKFEFQINKDKMDQLIKIEKKWLDFQIHQDKDDFCNNIVECIRTNQYYDWSFKKLSIIDEAFIQRSLASNGVQIKCWGLNTFPTNTKDFLPLLEFNS